MGGSRDRLGPQGERFRFDAFELDARRLLLLQHGQPVDIEPKPLEVLAELLAHPGELVTKADLMDSVWAGRVVTEGVITRCINRLRAVLGDREQTLILTVHGYGYRFTGSVDAAAAAVPPAMPAATALQQDIAPPERPLWRLRRQLHPLADVWLAEHVKTGEQRVLKFASSLACVAGLKRELTILRLLRKTLGERPDLIRLLDYNLETAPYFLEFEYCELGSLADWLQDEGRTAPLTQRLELVAMAAETLAAAHAVGVLHQDIKPANILLWRDEHGRLRTRWNDFGIGAVAREQLDLLQLTALGMTGPSAGSPSGGTLSYLAPECAAGEAATLQSDIYSLGVVLLQMVVGDAGRTLAPGWERSVAHELLREDIAACCDVDPLRRLRDAAELARRLRQLDVRQQQRDVQRRVASEQARLVTVAAHRARLLRWLSATTVVVLLSAGFSAVQWARASRAQHAAETSRAITQQINRFFNEDLLGASDSFTKGYGHDVQLSDMLAAAQERLDQNMVEQPAVYAELSIAVAKAYENIGRFGEARQRLNRSLDTLQRQGADARKIALPIESALGDLALAQGDPAAAEPRYRQVLEAYREQFGDSSAEVFGARASLVWTRYEAGYFEESYQLHQALIADIEASPEPDQWLLADLRWNLIDIACELARWDEAERLIAMVETDYLARFGADHPRLLYLWESKAYYFMARERWADAEALLQEILQKADRRLGALNPVTTTARDFLGTIYLDQGDAARALPLLQAGFDARLAHHGKRHYLTRMSMNRVGRALSTLGRHDEALALLDEAFGLSVAQLGAEHPHTLDLEWALAQAEAAAGHRDDAEAHYREAIALGPTRMQAGNFRIALAQLGLGQLYAASERREQAAPLLQAAARNFAAFYGEHDRHTRLAQRLIQELDAAAPAGAVAQWHPAY